MSRIQVKLYQTDNGACPYLNDKTWHNLSFQTSELPPDGYTSLLEISDKQLFSSNLLDVSWPALIMSELNDKVEIAERTAKDSVTQSVTTAARYLDFQSIRFVYDSAKRLNDKSIIKIAKIKIINPKITNRLLLN